MNFFEEYRNKQSDFYRWLWDEIESLAVFDTHEHITPPWYHTTEFKSLSSEEQNLSYLHPFEGEFEISTFFERAYVYMNYRKGQTYDEIANFLQRYRGTGYLRALMIAVADLYKIEPPITAKYLEKLHNALNEAYSGKMANFEHDRKIFEEKMHVKGIVLDNNPIDLHKYFPQPLFKKALRIAPIVNLEKVPTNVPIDKIPVGNTLYWFAGKNLNIPSSEITNLDEYCKIIDSLIDHAVHGDYVSFKIQIAYHRHLWFDEPSESTPYSRLNEIFMNDRRSEQDYIELSNHIMHYFLENLPIGCKMPIQFHTGLAQISDGGSNAMNLSYLFKKFPDYTFDLFHGNYPWLNLAGMMHQIPNIYADLTWMPSISPSAAQQLLTQLFEVGHMVNYDSPDNVPSLRTNLFGGDVHHADGSYGALMNAKDVLCRSLDDLHSRGVVLKADAVDLAKQVLYDNPARIFGRK